MTFDQAFEQLIGHEGGFTKDPKDPGNWTGGKVNQGQLVGTKYGVSAASYPDLDIYNLTLNQAREVYRRDYWDRIGAAKIDQRLRYSLFDMAVNAGVYTSVKILQRAAGVAVDGIVGPHTLEAARGVSLSRLQLYRLNYYCQLVRKNNSLAKYIGGWSNRVMSQL